MIGIFIGLGVEQHPTSCILLNHISEDSYSPGEEMMTCRLWHLRTSRVETRESEKGIRRMCCRWFRGSWSHGGMCKIGFFKKEAGFPGLSAF